MFTILFHNDALVAIHKPPKIKVHRGAYDPRREDFVLQRLRDQIGQRLFPVHRLDRATSGVLVFALTRGAARSLARSFARQEVRKTYLAVVRGFTAERGQVDRPLTKDPRDRGPDARRQTALTRYIRLDTVELPIAVGPYASSRYSLVRVEPRTGRMHQIRRHLCHLAHPVIGDRQYGDNKHNRSFSENWDCRRLLLAATELMLPLPGTHAPLKLVAPLEGIFHEMILTLGWAAAVPAAWMARGADTTPGFDG
ncbi:MAG: pseudouridine synthase [Desulfobacterales bacterium]|nr:pseudouridine synthase [Desulfobacterales bacterium]